MQHEKNSDSCQCGPNCDRFAGSSRIGQKGNKPARRQGGRDRRELALQKHRPTHNESHRRPSGAPPVSEGPAREWHGHRQFGQDQHPREIQQTHNQRSKQYRDRPIILECKVPAKVLAGNHHPDAKRPNVANLERFFQCEVREAGLSSRRRGLSHEQWIQSADTPVRRSESREEKKGTISVTGRSETDSPLSERVLLSRPMRSPEYTRCVNQMTMKEDFVFKKISSLFGSTSY